MTGTKNYFNENVLDFERKFELCSKWCKWVNRVCPSAAGGP